MSGNFFRRLPRFKVINANQPCHVYTQMWWSWESSSVRIGVSQDNPCPRSSRSPFRIVYEVNVVQYAIQFECMESCILYIQCAERNDWWQLQITILDTPLGVSSRHPSAASIILHKDSATCSLQELRKQAHLHDNSSFSGANSVIKFLHICMKLFVIIFRTLFFHKDVLFNEAQIHQPLRRSTSLGTFETGPSRWSCCGHGQPLHHLKTTITFREAHMSQRIHLNQYGMKQFSAFLGKFAEFQTTRLYLSIRKKLEEFTWISLKYPQKIRKNSLSKLYFWGTKSVIWRQDSPNAALFSSKKNATRNDRRLREKPT